MKRKTHEQYVQELAIKNPNVIAFERYLNSNTPILHYCITHGAFWKTTPSRALQGVGCEECRIEKFRKVRCKTHEQYVKEVGAINSDIIVIGEYVDATTPIKFYCKRHKIYWNTFPDNILRGHGCVECGNERVRNKNIKSHNEYVKDLSAVNPNIEVIEDYQGANIAILHRCKIDGHIWLARPYNILSGKGCPKCNEPHGEKQIRQWLCGHNIKYISQKTFDDYKDKKPLPFDFYLPEYNICIEYDGEQHFRPVDFFGGEAGFKQRKLHDAIKTEYCKNNNIRLLRILYFKNIEEELENFLFI